MAPRSIWVLNLDAEYELADPRGYTPSRAAQARLRAFAAQAMGLLQPGDQVLEAGARPTLYDADAAGQAWCPTPRALQQLRAAGVSVPHSPALAVLQRVNDRRFAIELDPGPLGARYCTELALALAWLTQPASSGRWLLKRAFGLAGRGHRRVDGAPTEADARWLQNSFQLGHGVALEPWVDRIADFALHGRVERGGGVALGRVLLQRCDAQGAWRQSLPLPAGQLLAHEAVALERSALRAGAALQAAGYFGPFGIDAFAFRDADGQRAFQSLVEINARYSMGWPLSGL